MTTKKKSIIGFVHLLVLWNFAISQPIFDILLSNIDFLTTHGSKGTEIFILVIGLVFLLPLIFILLELIIGGLSQPIHKFVHFLIIGILTAVILLPLYKKTEIDNGFIILFLSLVSGFLLPILMSKYQVLKQFLTFLSPAVLIFPLVFILNPSVYKIIAPQPLNIKTIQPDKTYPPIVMVVFDELPLLSLLNERGMIDPVRYPNFAKLAKGSFWLRNGTTVADSTVSGAVPAILTGLYPENYVDLENEYETNLFSFLSGAYKLNINEIVTNFCPDSLCPKKESLSKDLFLIASDLSLVFLHIILPDSLTEGLPPVSQNWVGLWGPKAQNLFGILGEKSAPDRMKKFADFVSSLTEKEEPELSFLHILLPHVPWSFLPSGETYGELFQIKMPGVNKKDMWGDDEWSIIQAYQRHLLQLGYVDKLLGDLLTKLENERIYDKSLIIVTSDHGLSFTPPHSRSFDKESNMYEIMPVPFFIKIPGQNKGVITDQNVETIDILPTIADLLGVEIPWKIDGFSILKNAPEKRIKVMYKDIKEGFLRTVIRDTKFQKKFEVLKNKISLFGTSSNDLLFRNGPYNHLIGKHISNLVIEKESKSKIRLNLENPGILNREIKNISTEAPIPIVAHINLPDNEKNRLHNILITSNGIVAAVTRSYKIKPDRELFFSFIPEHFLQKGKNKLRIFIVREKEKNLFLEELFYIYKS